MIQGRVCGRARWLSALAVIAVLAVAQVALAAEFSANMVTSGGGVTVSGTIYVQGTNLRHEVSRGKQKQIIIVNSGKKMMWVADPVAKTYWGKKLSDKDLAVAADELKGKLPPEMQIGKPKKVGTETVNGFVCDKLVAQGRGGKITTWMAQKLNFPVRTLQTTTQGLTVQQDYKDIKQRSLPASLFAAPKGYKQVTSPVVAGRGGLQGRRGGMRRGPGGRVGRRGGR